MEASDCLRVEVGSARANYAFKATGDVALLGFSGLALTGSNWTASANTLGDLSGAASVSVQEALLFCSTLPQQSFSGAATLIALRSPRSKETSPAKDGTNHLLAGQSTEVFVR